MQMPWSVEVVRCINEWAHGRWDANEMTWKNPSTSAQLNDWTNEPTNWWTNESMNAWVNESMKQRSNDSMNQATTETTNRWINEPMNQWRNVPIMNQQKWINEPMNRWFSESMNQWTDDSAKQWTSESVHEWFNYKEIRWMQMLLSLQSGAHLVFQKCSDPIIFLFAGPIFGTSAPSMPVFAILIWNRALATVSCTFWRCHLPEVLWACQFFNVLKC